MKQVDVERQQAVEGLRELIKPGDRVYTVLRHVSRSGAQRVVDVQLIKDGALYWIGRTVARVIQSRFDDRLQGIVIGGCGSDVGFDIVYALSYQLFKDGFDCIGEGCPANDHSNGDRNFSPHRHKDPGYALRQSWI